MEILSAPNDAAYSVNMSIKWKHISSVTGNASLNSFLQVKLDLWRKHTGASAVEKAADASLLQNGVTCAGPTLVQSQL